jgi:hypothetical protein
MVAVYRTCALAAGLVFALMAVPIARAAKPEQTYLTARDWAVAAVKKAGSSKAGQAQEKRLRGTLTTQMRALVGATKFDGFPGPGRLNPATLNADDAGALDGLMFSDSDGTRSLLVSTEGLLLPWLKAHADWWKDEANVPTDAESAFESKIFNTQTVGGNADVAIFAPVPIDKPAGAEAATAFLAQRTQAVPTSPPNDLAVAVDKGGKIFVAVVRLEPELTPIAACETILKEAQGKVDDEGSADYLKCWREKARSQADFAAVTAKAHALADMLARH